MAHLSIAQSPVTTLPSGPLHTDLPLAYLIRPAQDSVTHPPLLLLLHGVGSNERDLFRLADQVPAQFLVVSARSPLSLGPDAYGFYQVDFSTGRPVYNAAEEQHSREVLVQFIGELIAKHGINAQEVYLLGFSQGAIESYSVALTAPHLVRGVLAFGGRILNDVKAQHAPDKNLQRIRFFVRHGRQDTTLPVAYAREARQFLQQAGIQPDYEEFEGGHGLFSEQLRDAMHWLLK